MPYATYSKSLRERAKKNGEYLVTVEFVRPSGTVEMASQGPLTQAQAKRIADVWLDVIKQRSSAKR